MEWRYNDGGRKEAGYKHFTRDCAVRAVAIATGRPYKVVYAEINMFGKKERPRGGKKRSNSRTGVFRRTLHKYLSSLGWKWKATMHIGSGCKVHMREEELPKGRIICSLSRHFAVVINGVLHDTYDCTRDGMRCVYGYWYKEEV